MEEAEQNRSEEPTSFKLSRARQKGTVARGLDLGFATSLVAFAGYGWIMGPALAAQLSQAARNALVAATTTASGPNEVLIVTGKVLAAPFKPLAFLMAVIFGAVLVFELVQTGVVFSTEPLRLDFGKLNPAKGLKRVFSLRMLVETGKSLLKMAGYCAAAILVMRWAWTNFGDSIGDASSLAAALRASGLRLLSIFIVAAIAFAVLDQLLVRRDFLKRMRMSRREVRREMRDREGEPRLKQRRRQMHGEFVKASHSLRNIKGADLLIVNPTHYAVALRYDARSMTAPTVVSQGANQLAQRLKRLAFQHGVVIVHNAPLAQALYRGPFNRQVPEALYPQVADLYQQTREARARRGAYGRV
ncbi:MAG TPA: EscU/YscU/HrcU family type III secretion system export apparatus switch protein [Caulobacteraceae bacterium]|jgi:flagellar biosynthetic protein FlhB